MSGNANSGGARRGAGPPRRNLQLSKERAKSWHLLTKRMRRTLNNPDLTVEDAVDVLVEREWREIDADYQGAAEAHEPFIV